MALRNWPLPFRFMLAALWPLLGLVVCIDEGRAGERAGPELATVCVDELCGYVDSRGRWQIPPRFRAADPFAPDGLARVIVTGGVYTGRYSMGLHGPASAATPYAGGFGLINTSGDYVLEPIFEMIRPFAANGLAAVRLNDRYDAKSRLVGSNSVYKWGFADRQGRLVIEPQFEEVGDFAVGGLAPARLNDRWGFIDSAGQWVIEPDFGYVNPFPDSGPAMVRAPGPEGRWGFIDASGNWVLESAFDRLEQLLDTGLAVVVKDKKYGLISGSGQWVLKPEYDGIYFPKGQDQGSISIEGQSGLIDTSGQWLAELAPDSSGYPLFEGSPLTKVRPGEQWGIIGPDGQWLLKPQFDDIAIFNRPGLIKAKAKGRFGLINAQGRLIVEPKFHHLQAWLNNGLIAAGNNGVWGLIDLQGNWVVEPRFERLELISDQGLIGAKQGGLWGAIDLKGQWVIEPRFEQIGHFSERGLATAKVSAGQGLVPGSGRGYFVQPVPGEIFRYGLIDTRGQWVVEPIFEFIRSFADQGLWAAQVNNRWGIVDASGRWILKPKLAVLSLIRAGNLEQANISDGGYWHQRAYLDRNSAAYRTGLDINVEEPGFRWELAEGLRSLFNRRGQKILVIDPSGENEVAKNAAGAITWPPAGEPRPTED